MDAVHESPRNACPNHEPITIAQHSLVTLENATQTPILHDDDVHKEIEKDTGDIKVATMADNDETWGDDDFEFGDFTEAGSSGGDDTEYVSHALIDNSETQRTDDGVLADELRAYQDLLERPGGRDAFVDKVQGTDEVSLSMDTSKLCTLDSLEREDAYASLLQLRKAPVSSRQGYSEESVFRQKLVDKLHLNAITTTTCTNPSNAPHTNCTSAAEEEEEEQEQQQQHQEVVNDYTSQHST